MQGARNSRPRGTCNGGRPAASRVLPPPRSSAIVVRFVARDGPTIILTATERPRPYHFPLDTDQDRTGSSGNASSKRFEHLMALGQVRGPSAATHRPCTGNPESRSSASPGGAAPLLRQGNRRRPHARASIRRSDKHKSG